MKRIFGLMIILLLPAAVRAQVIKDDVGRLVDIKTPVSRIVCLSPANEEMIYWMGQESKLIAVSKGCDYPGPVKNLAKAGDFMNPDTEMILKLKPDLVISGGGIQKKAILKLESLSVPVVVLYPLDFTGIVNNMRLIALVTGAGKRADRKIDGFKKQLDGFKPAAGKKISVYAEIWNQPAMSVGRGSFINEIINAAGGENIISDSTAEYPKASREEIIKRNPRAIILLYTPETGYMNRDYIAMTDAGKNKKVLVLTGASLDRIMRPGPRVVDAVRELKDFFDGKPHNEK